MCNRALLALLVFALLVFALFLICGTVSAQQQYTVLAPVVAGKGATLGCTLSAKMTSINVYTDAISFDAGLIDESICWVNVTPLYDPPVRVKPGQSLLPGWTFFWHGDTWVGMGKHPHEHVELAVVEFWVK